jgi:hypothetical protein
MTQENTRTTLPSLLMLLLVRIVAVGCLWYGLKIWGEIIGYSEGGALRFDLLTTDVKAAKATLAVLYPVAAVGLWLRGPWGPVIWGVMAAMELFMHQYHADIFGAEPVKMVAIAVTAVLYLVLRILIVLTRPVKSPAGQG